ncbi:hypothetical protein AWB71_02359 [Caballeronia peredens]|nr:hypothetical protein AWB71_02359 [Caballeronia peredens]
MALRTHDADRIGERMNHGGLLPGDPGQAPQATTSARMHS